MSIYIKGQDLPGEGECYLLQINSDGTVYDVAGRRIAAHAVSVPPHGDLIDRDVLKSDGFYTLVCYTGRMPYPYTAMLIDDTSTIIPAEEEWDMSDNVKDYPPYLDYPKPRKTITNADRIRAMTDEELDGFLNEVQGDAYLVGFHARSESRFTPYGKSWLDWLKEEATP